MNLNFYLERGSKAESHRKINWKWGRLWRRLERRWEWRNEKLSNCGVIDKDRERDRERKRERERLKEWKGEWERLKERAIKS